MPACINRSMMRGEELAGPMVQTIFEWRNAMVVCVSPVVYVIGGHFLLVKIKIWKKEKRANPQAQKWRLGTLIVAAALFNPLGLHRRASRRGLQVAITSTIPGALRT
jgi:hypothetical protein